MSLSIRRQGYFLTPYLELVAGIIQIEPLPVSSHGRRDHFSRAR